MILLILDTIALAGAFVGAFAGARAISNIDTEKEKFKKISSLYDEAFQDLKADLMSTKKLIQEYSQLRQDTISNTENIFHFLDENIPEIKKLHSSELSIQQIQECKNAFHEIKQYLAVDTNTVESLNNCYGITHLANPIKLAVQKIVSHDLRIKQAITPVRNCISKSSINTIGASIIIFSLLASANIAVSPAVLITSFILHRLQEKYLIQLKEYESEINAAIVKINSTQDLMLKTREKISESMKKLKSSNDSLNEFIFTANMVNFTRQTTQFASELVPYAPVDNTIKRAIPLIKFLAEKFIPKILDYEGKLKNATLSIKENSERSFLLGLDEITNINLERELLNV